MKTLKLLGIIALSALIIIWAVSCEGLFGPTDTLTDLEGNLTIQVSSEGQVIGCTLRANYVGDEDIIYEWFRDGISMTTFGTVGREQTYSPQSVGGYQVRINHVDDLNNEYPMFASNGPIFITDPSSPPVGPGTTPTVPTNREYYYGTWKMTGADNGGWLGGYSTGPVTDETMVVSATSFRVDSTHPSTTGSTGNTPYDTEFIEYTITRWDIDPVGAEGYQATYRLTVSNAKNWGYTITTGSSGSLYIYLFAKADGTLRWSNNKSGNIYPIWASAQNTAADKTRVYVRQQ